jgi:hypothetical protein
MPAHKTHGQTNTPLYRTWHAMRERCKTTHWSTVRSYKAQGIKVCKRWNSFVLFAADVGPHPGKGWSLDRKDNKDGYRPGNVRWATRATQQQNRNYGPRSGRLSLAKVAAMRAQYAAGARQIDLAAQYGVDQSMVSRTVNRRNWI